MAQRTVYDCDKCGKKNAETRQISVVVDRNTDGAGSMENWNEEVDLCIDCLVQTVRMVTNKFSYEDAKAWIKQVRK